MLTSQNDTGIYTSGSNSGGVREGVKGCTTSAGQGVSKEITSYFFFSKSGPSFCNVLSSDGAENLCLQDFPQATCPERRRVREAGDSHDHTARWRVTSKRIYELMRCCTKIPEVIPCYSHLPARDSATWNQNQLPWRPDEASML